MKRTSQLFLLIGVTICLLGCTFLVGPVSQSPAYHNLSDHRIVFGVPNFFNVLSNAPFFIIGFTGLFLVNRTSAPKPIKLVYCFLYLGITLVSFGSAYYHLNPNNDTLVWDRIPMTVVFMSLTAATVSEFISHKAGIYLLFPLIILGVGSVLYWHYTELQNKGDLRLYGFVQFYPMLFIPLVIILFSKTRKNNGVKELIWVVIWYAIAKVFEYFDAQIYSAGRIISGHSLKHLAAAVSTWYLVLLFRNKYIESGK